MTPEQMEAAIEDARRPLDDLAAVWDLREAAWLYYLVPQGDDIGRKLADLADRALAVTVAARKRPATMS